MKNSINNSFNCPKCPKTYNQISAVYRHMDNTHNYPEGRPCPICGKKIKDLYNHKKKFIAIINWILKIIMIWKIYYLIIKNLTTIFY